MRIVDAGGPYPDSASSRLAAVKTFTPWKTQLNFASLREIALIPRTTRNPSNKVA